MIATEFCKALRSAANVSQADAALAAFMSQNSVRWIPFGRENNRGTIEVSSDPARSAVERLTNGIDAVIELEYQRHTGLPICRSPREAAVAWLGVPDAGLSGMTPAQRRALAQRVTIRLEAGDGREGRVLEVSDRGIGLTPEEMPRTILSLNESNKLQKHYLAGAYGQGGSSTLAFSRLTFIASRHGNHEVGFTVARFLDLPPDLFKTGHYVYLVLQDGRLPVAQLSHEDFPNGTVVRHFGYDLSSYPSPLGPNSLYGSLNTTLFDPVMPIWLDNRVHDYRRVIKGSRNALNGAIDDGDEHAGPRLSHSIPMFSVSLGDFGRIGIEYWVLEQPTTANKRPSAAFLNPSRPIILTLNGQNQGEFSQLTIKKDCELPFLSQRLICHIDCNHLSHTSKRQLFVSTRESQRDVKVRELILQELIKALKSDDVLARLNDEARQQGVREQDETAIQQMRGEVARLLRIHGLELGQPVGGDAGGQGPDAARPVRPPRPRPRPEPIELHEPPTYIRILWGEDEDITFYPEQRRYVRIVTDANSTYHNPNDVAHSRINVIVGDQLILRGSTALLGGRMRAVVEGASGARIGQTGTLRVELTRPGLPVLVDERTYRIIAAPEAHPSGRRVSLPPFRVEAVEGPDDPKWTQLGWPDNPTEIASEAVMESGLLVIYYSTAFPKYVAQRLALERRDPILANSFMKRYEIWLAVHSLLHYQDKQAVPTISDHATSTRDIGDSDLSERRDREERCRVAVMSCLFSAREVQMEASRTVAADAG
jgi:hypothetical protein